MRVSTVPLSDSYNGLKRYWGTASLIGQVAVPATKLIPAEYDTAQYETNQNRMLVSIPPNLSVGQFMGYLRGKSALMIFDHHANLKYR